MTLPVGIRKVYNHFYKKKSLGGSSVPTPSQIKEYLESRGFDLDNIDDEEFNQAIDYFSKGELSVIQQDGDVEELPLRGSAVVHGGNPQEHTVSPNELAITSTSKSELVASAAESLGIILNTQEVINIADNINYSSDNLHDSLDEIKSAIITFIQHKALLNNQKINQVISDINQVASSEFSNNSQQLTEGLQSVNRQMQQQNTDFKSKVKSAIAAFAIPPAG
jgi:hypothetical protein